MIRLSSGLRGAMLWDAGLRLMMWRGKIDVYSGPQPESADFAPTGTLLGSITENGDPFVVGAETGGLRLDGVGMTHLVHVGDWQFNGDDSGTPGWWRYVWNLNDPGTDSNYYPRIDGTVGESLFNMPGVVNSATVVSGIEFNLFFN